MIEFLPFIVLGVSALLAMACAVDHVVASIMHKIEQYDIWEEGQ